MSTHRPNVPVALKQQLFDEAGRKCANPGCSSHRAHTHHIREWAVYESHDSEYMVAVCPSCHDAVHHGPLEIDDDTIRRWKSIERSTETVRDHLYVDPGDSPKLILGGVGYTGDGGLTVFELGRSNKLSFRLEDTDIMLVSLSVCATTGEELIRVVDGHLRHDVREPVRYQRVQGHIRLTAPAEAKFMPDWALSQLRVQEPEFATDGRLTLLDLEVLEPGVVRVQGIWTDPRRVVAITPTRLAFLDPNATQPLSIMKTVADFDLHFTGPMTAAFFGLGDAPAALPIPTAPGRSVGRNDPCWCGSDKKFKKCHGA